MLAHTSPKRSKILRQFASVCLLLLLISCGSGQKGPPAPPPLNVTVIKIEPQDASIVYQYVGQAVSSRQVEIRARVDGFLDKIAYEEGDFVEPGQILFELDKKPYEAALQQAEGELALQQARLVTASSNLKRIRPLAEQDAVSQKDLDDAVGTEKGAQAAVLAAEGVVAKAELNLGYATIYSPLRGLASKSDQRVGSYIPTGEGGLLTYVAQLNPIWINFSVSENQILRFRQEVDQGKVLPPKEMRFVVEAVLADGTSHPYRGEITFTEPNIDPTTGTFLLRAELKNPEGNMRPGQFVTVKLHGAKRPNAILVPQQAVIQGAKGHFVFVVDHHQHPQVRSVEVGPWHQNQWFIDDGLLPGDLVIIDQVMKLNPDRPIKIVKEKKQAAEKQKN